MTHILRITNTSRLRSADPDDGTTRLGDASHQYFFFSRYRVLEEGTWEEGRSWVGTISVESLFTMMHDAGLLREVTTTKQSGGDHHD